MAHFRHMCRQQARRQIPVARWAFFTLSADCLQEVPAGVRRCNDLEAFCWLQCEIDQMRPGWLSVQVMSVWPALQSQVRMSTATMFPNCCVCLYQRILYRQVCAARIWHAGIEND